MKANRRLSAVLVLAGLMLAGCPRDEVRPTPSGSRPEVLSLMRQRAESLKTLRAKVSMEVKLSEMKNAEKLTGNFAASGPASLRLMADHPLADYRVLDLGCDGSTWWVHVHAEETNRVDYGRVADLSPVDCEVPVRPDQIVAILGMAPLRDRPPDAHWVFTLHPGHYLLQEVVRSNGTRHVATRIHVDGKTQLITRYETLLPSGRIRLSATLGDYHVVDDVQIPGMVRIRVLTSEGEDRLDLRFTEVKVNPKLPSNVFKPLRFEKIPQRIRHPQEVAVGRMRAGQEAPSASLVLEKELP